MLNEIIGTEPAPEFALQVSEESENLLWVLPDEDLRRLALLKMEGHTNEQAAKSLGCGKRTVERRLALIRELWIHRATSEEEA